MQEREEAARVLGAGAEAPAATFEPDEELAEAEEAAAAAAPAVSVPSKGPTAAQITAIKAAIASAATLEEVQRLENALKTGHVPSEVQVSTAPFSRTESIDDIASVRRCEPSGLKPTSMATKASSCSFCRSRQMASIPQLWTRASCVSPVPVMLELLAMHPCECGSSIGPCTVCGFCRTISC